MLYQLQQFSVAVAILCLASCTVLYIKFMHYIDYMLFTS